MSFVLLLTNARERNVDTFSSTTENFDFYERNLKIRFANTNLAIYYKYWSPDDF